MPYINSEFTSEVLGEGGALLRYLAKRFTYRNVEQWKTALESAHILVNKHVVKDPEYVLKHRDNITFLVENYFEPNVPIDFHIIKREQGLLYVHKPADLPVHRTGTIFFHTLVNLLRNQEQKITINPVNRLDRETSGVVVFAEDTKAASQHAPFHKGIEWIKLYIAVVPQKAGISVGQEGIWESYLDTREGSVIRCQMYVEEQGTSHAKKAITYYQILQEKKGFQLVLLAPITGRKHQLRAHLAHYHTPIVGDKIYSLEGAYFLKRLEQELEVGDFEALGANHHLLHCWYTAIHKEGVLVGEAESSQLSKDWDSYFTREEMQFLLESHISNIIKRLLEFKNK